MVFSRSTKRTEGSWFLSEVEEGLLSVLDVKDYVFCPRVVYFRKVLHAKEEMGSQQAAAREDHGKLDEKEARRIDITWIEEHPDLHAWTRTRRRHGGHR